MKVHDNEHGITADLTFEARAKPVEEPRFTYRQGPRTVMDYTRLTQNGLYEGHIDVKGTRIDIDYGMVLGTRDRSWGVRPIGLADPQGVAPPRPPQFYWLWAPLNFPDRFMLYHLNAEASGKPWNTASVLGELDEAEAGAHGALQFGDHLQIRHAACEGRSHRRKRCGGQSNGARS